MKKFVTVILSAVCAIVCAFAFTACDFIKIKGGDTKEFLSAPQNVKYDKGTYTLSWDSVQDNGCTGYEIDYNGKLYTTEQTSYVFMYLSAQNAFKVRALTNTASPETGERVTSEWSQTVTYDLPATPSGSDEQKPSGGEGETPTQPEVSLFDRVNAVLKKIAEENELELVKVIGISYASLEGKDWLQFAVSKARGSGLYNICFETLCNQDDKIINIRMLFDGGQFNIIADMINNIEKLDYLMLCENTVDFNSAEKLVQSGSYDGKMQKLADQGYKISVVDSCAREGKKIGGMFRFEIVGLYKAERGDGTLYFTSINRVNIDRASVADKNNYLHSVSNPEARTITEKAFVLHDGETSEYIEALVKSNNSQIQAPTE